MVNMLLVQEVGRKIWETWSDDLNYSACTYKRKKGGRTAFEKGVKILHPRANGAKKGREIQ